jgi:glycosyltransferase involved in cell wall biosynthesis
MTIDHNDGVPQILRVVETPPRYPPFIGGVENVAQAVCSRLVANGDQVVVVCADEPRGSANFGDGVPIRRLPWRFKVANTNITIKLPIALAQMEWDVVSTHLPTPWSADWSVIIARLLGRASTLSFYNAIVGEGLNSVIARLYRGTLFRLLLRWADRIIVVSEHWHEVIVTTEPSTRDRLRVIPTGVELETHSVGTGGDGRQLLFVGILDRFHRYKGLGDLLQALVLMRRPFHLRVIGDGALKEEYERMSAELGLFDKITFLGHVSADRLKIAYQSSDVYILPSKVGGQEGGFTLTALEAMASGIPVVLADGVGQLARNVVEVGAGIHVPAEDPGRLANALERLLGDEELRKRMGAAARRYVEEHHSWDAITEQRRAVLLEAVQAASDRVQRQPRLARAIRVATSSVFSSSRSARNGGVVVSGDSSSRGEAPSQDAGFAERGADR